MDAEIDRIKALKKAGLSESAIVQIITGGGKTGKSRSAPELVKDMGLFAGFGVAEYELSQKKTENGKFAIQIAKKINGVYQKNNVFIPVDTAKKIATEILKI